MSAPERPSQELPAAFGKYLLTELIAVGGMAEVYKAKIFGASGFEKDMVVKRILPRYAKNPSFVQMLIDEAKIAVRLSHGNIVPIYELGELDGAYYIAMEYVDGSTLLDVLRMAHEKQRPLPPAFSLGIAAEVAAGLSYAHRQKGADGSPLGLVHRDINPRNIVVTPSGEVKILDFGIARASTKKHQTKSGVIKGTPGYMSPEQMYGFSVDHRSDQFCVGILLYELLTLSRLYPAWTVQEMRDLYEGGPLAPPSSRMPSLSADVDAVVLKALAKKPEDRFADTGDFEEALRQVIVQTQTAVTATGLARELASLGAAEVPEAPALELRPAEASAVAAAPLPDSGVTSASTPTAKAPSRPPTPVIEPTPEPADALANAETKAKLPRPAAGTPATEPMGTQKSADLKTGQHAFVISLAADQVESSTKTPLAPLPKTSMRPGDAPMTQVLAKNSAVEWDEAIGSDAELLALAKQVGSAPGQTKKTLAFAAAFAVVALVVFGGVFAGEIADTLSRAISGKKVRAGAMVIKTKPAGAAVVLDGEEKGATNLKLINIDPDVPHTLEITIEGEGKRVVEIAPKDFRPLEGMPTFVFEQEPEEEAVEDAGPPAVVEPTKKKPKKKNRKRRRRKRR